MIEAVIYHGLRRWTNQLIINSFHQVSAMIEAVIYHGLRRWAKRRMGKLS